MHNKKFTKLFLYISLPIILLVPSINIFLLDEKISKTNIYSIDTIESKINYLLYKKYLYSLIPGQVIVGKEDFLFLGNDYNNVLSKTNGEFRPSKDEINQWTDKLKNLQKWYESKGIKFVIVIAPNKHTVYKEKLPEWMKYSGETLTDDIVKFSQNKKINMLDLRPILKENKGDEILYWKTDTHWNEKGASIGYEKIIDYLNTKLNIKILKPEYTLVSATRGGGDLAGFLKINSILKNDFEKSYLYKFTEKFDICRGNMNKKNANLEECIVAENPIMEINLQSQYIINKSVEKNKLLYLCDSFGIASSQLFNSSFNTIWKWHWGHINGARLADFIEINKPDIVIYQVIERDLYNHFIVQAMSNTIDIYENK